MQVVNPAYMMSESAGPGDPASQGTVSDTMPAGVAVTCHDRNVLVNSPGQRDTFYWRGRSVRKLFLWQVGTVLFCLLFVIMVIVHTQRGGGEFPPTAAPVTHSRHECLEKACVDKASIMINMMNDSVDPCQDFFSYACGGLEEQVYDVLTESEVHSVFDWMDEHNEDVVLRLLQKLPKDTPPSDPVMKARNLYDSCMNQFDNGRHSSALLFDIINDMGGLDLLGTWNESAWHKNTAIIKMHSEHWTNTLWKFYWTDNALKPGTNMLQIGKGRVALPERSFKSTQDAYAKSLSAYKQFIRSVMQRVVSSINTDNNNNSNNNSSNKINNNNINNSSNNSNNSDVTAPCFQQNITKCLLQFADDVVFVEALLVNNSTPRDPRNNLVPLWRRLRSDPSRYTTVGALTQQYPQIEWMGLFRALVGESVINHDTPVKIPARGYLQHVVQLVHTSTKRQLHHFIVWNIVYHFIHSLGSDYLHDYYRYWQTLSDSSVPPVRETFCRHQLRTTMSQAMAHLFVMRHVGLSQVRQCDSFMTQLRDNFSQSLAEWLRPSASLDGATGELGSLELYAGYLHWVMEGDRLRHFYSSLNIDSRRFFHNVKAIDKFKRHKLHERLQTGGDGSADAHRWRIDAWQTKVATSLAQKSVAVTAGAIKLPIYHSTLPHYLNLASLGSLIAEKLALFTITPASVYRTPGWWSQQTNHSLATFRQCIRQLYNNHTINVPPYFRTKSNVAALDPQRFMSRLVQVHNALNFAFDQHARLADSQHALIPGLPAHFTHDRLFFLAYVQTRCVVRYPSKLRYILFRLSGEIPADIMMNTAVYGHEKFNQAYGCETPPASYVQKMCRLR